MKWLSVMCCVYLVGCTSCATVQTVGKGRGSGEGWMPGEDVSERRPVLLADASNTTWAPSAVHVRGEGLGRALAYLRAKEAALAARRCSNM